MVNFTLFARYSYTFHLQLLISFTSPMQILFAIAVLCCCALIWAAISIARHIRQAHHNDGATKQSAFRDALLRAGYSDPPIAGRRGAAHPREDMASGRARPKNTGFIAERRPPASVHTANDVRSDWKYFNRDSGDLSDPDTHRVRGVLPSSQRKRS